jgi:hypothetical protein
MINFRVSWITLNVRMARVLTIKSNRVDNTSAIRGSKIRIMEMKPLKSDHMNSLTAPNSRIEPIVFVYCYNVKTKQSIVRIK